MQLYLSSELDRHVTSLIVGLGPDSFYKFEPPLQMLVSLIFLGDSDYGDKLVHHDGEESHPQNLEYTAEDLLTH